MTIGHNSMHLSLTQKDSLRKFVDEIEALEGQKSEIAEEIEAAYEQVKVAGLDRKAVKQMIRERSEDKEQREARQEQEAIRDLYRVALGLT